MYKVRIECNGEVLEIMETDKMSSSAVYKTVLADIKGFYHREALGRSYVRYNAFVYKDGKFLYLLALACYGCLSLSERWLALTRADDMKTCFIYYYYSNKEG